MSNNSGLLNTSSKSPIIFIAIDGKGGAGKSTLAAALAKELDAEIIHTDDITTFDRPTFDGADAVIEKVFDPINRGEKTLSYDRLQVWPGEAERVFDQNVTDIMIIEGCGVSCEKFRPYLSYVIVTELDDNTRIKRIIERDVIEGGRDESDNDEIGKIWEMAENKYFEHDDPRIRSNLIVNSVSDFDVTAILKSL